MQMARDIEELMMMFHLKEDDDSRRGRFWALGSGSSSKVGLSFGPNTAGESKTNTYPGGFNSSKTSGFSGGASSCSFTREKNWWVQHGFFDG